MRKALNENPVVQLSVLGVLLVVVGLFFSMRVLKKDEPAPAADSAGTASASGLATPGTTTPVTVSPDGSEVSSAAPTSAGATSPSVPSVTGGTVTPEALIPGPGLPKDVVDAWKGGDAIVLLIVRGGGIDDRLVRSSVEALGGDSGVSVFVTRAKHIARYSRITQGAGVSRVPAIVVVRPRRASGSVPEAQVSYGFRSAQSVVRAVHDALYTGPDDLPYSPG